MANEKVPAHNKLEILDNGIMVLTQTGYQTIQSIGQFQTKVDDLTTQRHEQDKKALILVDMTGVTGHDPEAREEGKLRIDGEYDALAICGSDIALRMIVNWLIKLTGKGDRVQFFASKADAMQWLEQQL